VYGGYKGGDRAGRFCLPHDGQADSCGIFSQIAKPDTPEGPVLEWECAFKHSDEERRKTGKGESD